MSTTLSIIQDQRGFTVQSSTTHQTPAGALAHFTELLAQFKQADSRRAAQDPAAAGDAVLTATTELPYRWEGPGHNGQPLVPPPAPALFDEFDTFRHRPDTTREQLPF